MCFLTDLLFFRKKEEACDLDSFRKALKTFSLLSDDQKNSKRKIAEDTVCLHHKAEV